MNKLCCPNCYKFTSFESTEPSFCGFCGKSFKVSTEAIASKPAPTPIPKRSKPLPVVYEDDEPLIESVPQNVKIEFTIDPKIKPRTELGQNLMGTKQGDPVPISSIKNKQTKTLSKEELQKYWAEQFPKTNRQNPTTIGDKE